MIAEADAMILDPDDRIPARSRIMQDVVDTLQETHDDWYAEQDTDKSITLSTPLGKYSLVVVELNE